MPLCGNYKQLNIRFLISHESDAMILIQKNNWDHMNSRVTVMPCLGVNNIL